MSDTNPAADSRRMPLWQEITIILAIKAAALYLIWLAFFSAPAAKHLDAAGIASSLLRPQPQSLHPPPPQEIGHAARPGAR